MLKHFIGAIAATTLSLVPLTETIAHAEPDQRIPGMTVVATFPPQNPPGNIAVTPDGRLFMSQHQFYGADYRVVEVLADGSTRPFPSEAWSTAPDANGIGLNNVLGIRSDGNGIIWMLDNPGGKGTAGRLVGWNTRTDSLHRVIYLAAPVIPDDPFLNDFAVDLYNNAVYIADTAGGSNSALIVVDLDTGYARRILAGHDSMRPEEIDMVIDGRVTTLNGEAARIGVNPITLDPNNEWVYYGPMTGRSLYRIRTEDLLDQSLTPEALAAKVERYGDKPISVGITIDGGGNVYVTDITNNAIGVTQPDGAYRVLYQDDDLSWTDGFGFGPDNQIYVTVNQLHRSPALNSGTDASTPPYLLLRFPALDAGIVGR